MFEHCLRVLFHFSSWDFPPLMLSRRAEVRAGCGPVMRGWVRRRAGACAVSTGPRWGGRPPHPGGSLPHVQTNSRLLSLGLVTETNTSRMPKAFYSTLNDSSTAGCQGCIPAAIRACPEAAGALGSEVLNPELSPPTRGRLNYPTRSPQRVHVSEGWRVGVRRKASK